MSNAPRKKGTAAETAVVRHAQARGFPWADRQPLRGARDQGDITLCPGVIVEAKSYAAAGTGQPPRKLLAKWLDDLAKAREVAGAGVALLVVKRAGTTNVGAWWCYLPIERFLELVGAPSPYDPGPGAWVCMTVDSALGVLRAHGYGRPIEVGRVGVAS